jgi:AcrR family transcriptional regulator
MSTRLEKTRARILDAARKLVAERGYQGLQLGEVAAAAGVSRQAIHRNHFSSKSALVLALANHVDVHDGAYRPFEAVSEAPDAASALDAAVAAAAAVDERIADVAGVLSAARAADPAAEVVWKDRRDFRQRRLEPVVRRLAAEHRLARGWSKKEAADFLAFALSPESYRALAVERGWSKKRYVDRMREVLRSALLRG